MPSPPCADERAGDHIFCRQDRPLELFAAALRFRCERIADHLARDGYKLASKRAGSKATVGDHKE